ncbi:MAG: hypothetical protein LBD75_06600 [Candidatus Peribacteria bacterium]|nr:hypothetical protein [Candidatus Peribacteria bacterium]
MPILFDHEIATHIMTSMGDYHNYNIRTPNSEDFEEGVALLNQYLTTHTTLDDFYESSIGDICQFLGEICDDQTLKEALQILYILNPSYTLTPETRFRRIRMGVPL